jgi:hypothetical protein
VVVDAIDSNGPAVGRLEPGDTIIACNDRLLPMTDALAHLRTQLSETGGDRPATLRVIRNGRMLEVDVPLAPLEPLPAQPGLAGLAAQLAPVENLAQSIHSAVLAVERPTDSGYRASITLTLANTQRAAQRKPPAPEVPTE